MVGGGVRETRLRANGEANGPGEVRSGSGAGGASSGGCLGNELGKGERVAHEAPALPEHARLQERQVRHQRPAQGRRGRAVTGRPPLRSALSPSRQCACRVA